jgi:hypothetical protein
MYKRLLRSVVAVALSTVVAYGAVGGGLAVTNQAEDSGWTNGPTDSGWNTAAQQLVSFDSGWTSSTRKGDA